MHMKTYTRLMVLAGLVLLAGCTTVPPGGVTSFSTGLTAAHQQSAESFQAVNQLIADASLDYAASQPRLLEESFAAGLDEESLQRWSQVFEKLEHYAQHLQALTSPDVTKSFETEAVALSSELKAFGQHLQDAGLVQKVPELTPAIATGFTELGNLIIRFHSQAEALKALRLADPQVGIIFRTMADSIGATRTNGVRGTVFTHWTQNLAEKKAAFLTASDTSAKRQIASDFRDLLERRTTQDLVLVSLRRSLLQLADLHHALAQGERWTAQTASAAIADEVKRTRALYDRLKEQLKDN
jgi:hypothetical protein